MWSVCTKCMCMPRRAAEVMMGSMNVVLRVEEHFAGHKSVETVSLVQRAGVPGRDHGNIPRASHVDRSINYPKHV